MCLSRVKCCHFTVHAVLIIPPWSWGIKRKGNISLLVSHLLHSSHQLFLSVDMHAFIVQSVFDGTITVHPRREACPQS